MPDLRLQPRFCLFICLALTFVLSACEPVPMRRPVPPVDQGPTDGGTSRDSGALDSSRRIEAGFDSSFDATTVDGAMSSDGAVDARPPQADAGAEAAVPDAYMADASNSGAPSCPQGCGVNASCIIGNVCACHLGFAGDGQTCTRTSERAVDLAIGDGHACALLSDGTLYCWGQVASSALQRRPERPSVVSHLRFSKIAPLSASTCGITTDGRVVCWGLNYTSGLSEVAGLPGSTVWEDIEGGLGNACVRSNQGELYCFGNNTFGQLGIGDTSRPTGAVRVNGFDSAVVHVAIGDTYLCAATQRGSVYCWGRGDRGVLGDPETNAHRFRPFRVRGLPAGQAEQVAVGYDHSCALFSSGRVFCWGANPNGQSGPSGGFFREVVVPNQLTTDLTAGRGVTCLRAHQDEQVYCIGRGSNLGDGTGSLRSAPTTPIVGGPIDGISFSLYRTWGCGLREGRVLCWGQNSPGQGYYTGGNLGDGTITDQFAPVYVVSPSP